MVSLPPPSAATKTKPRVAEVSTPPARMPRVTRPYRAVTPTLRAVKKWRARLSKAQAFPAHAARLLSLALADADPLAALATRCLIEADVDSALAAARLAVVADPSHFAGHFALGCALARSKRSAEAVTALERAVALRPEALGPHVCLGELHLSRLAYEPAVTELRLVMALDPLAQTPEGARAQALVAKTLLALD